MFVAKIDFINSNSKVAKTYNYCKPILVTSKSNGFIRASKLRHPICERFRTDIEYVAHDITIGDDGSDDTIEGMLLFGTNSSGKSTLMKGCALSLIMAQAGLYVPAQTYIYGPYQHIFARIITNDDMYRNFSSFTYEMTELSSILKRTGPKTAIFADEICNTTESISALSIVGSTILKLARYPCRHS